MTQGIFIHGRRPKSKKEIKEFVDRINEAAAHGYDEQSIQVLVDQYNSQRPNGKFRQHDFDPYGLVVEATSFFGNEFDGSLAEALRTQNYGPFTFVGPDPHSDRKFYGTLKYNGTKGKWEVK